jgi:cholinesterase
MNVLYAFGDSYLDSGAALSVSSAAVAAGVPDARVLPAPPGSTIYATGRWSDGPSMVEELATEMGVPLVNYAVGGAKASGGNYHAWLDYYVDTGLAAQVDSLAIAQRGARLAANAVCVIAAGTNDFFQYQDFRQPGYIVLGEAPRLSPASIAARAARSVGLAAERLHALGARRFLLAEAYAIEAAPFVVDVEAQVGHATSFVNAFDLALTAEVTRLTGLGLEVLVAPIGADMRGLAAAPESIGITEVRRACQPLLPVPGPRRGRPEQFFWWDEYHPTAVVHRALGSALAARIRSAGWA